MDQNTDDVNNLQSNQVIGMLQELNRDDKINNEQLQEFKTKFSNMHNLLIQTFQNHKWLHSKAKKLKSDLNLEKEKLERSQNMQSESQEKMEKLNQQIRKSEAEAEMYEHRNEVLNFEIDDLEQQKIEFSVKMQREEKEARMQIIPEINMINSDIESKKKDLQKRTDQIEIETKRHLDMQDKMKKIGEENSEKRQKIENLNNEYNKIKDDPARYSKNADMIANATMLMKNDRQSLIDEIEKKDVLIKESEQESEKNFEKITEQQLEKVSLEKVRTQKLFSINIQFQHTLFNSQKRKSIFLSKLMQCFK